MLLPNFNFHKPQSLSDAYQILDSCNNAALMAGGTDLLVEMKQGRRAHNDIISLNEIDELQAISEDENNIYIGPAVPFKDIQQSQLIKKYIPVLIDAVSKIGSHQVRNSGTIGGNLCTCASCADSAPILIVYGAEVELGSSQGNQRMMITDFQLHHHIINITKRQILIKIIVPKPKLNFYTNFQKFGLRESSSISVASVAVGFWIENSIISNAIIVAGACAPTPIKCKEASIRLNNIDIVNLYAESPLLNEIANATISDINPIDDLRGSAEYRREIIRAITKRAILNALSSSK